MRILYFSRDYTTHDHRFLSALSKTEHKVYYLRLERGKRQLEDRPLPKGIEQVQWRGGMATARFTDGPGLLLELKKIIRRIKPDLIQAGPLQRSAFLAALSGFRPLVSMSWGYDLIQDANRNAFWRWATRFTLKRSTLMVGDCNTIRQLAITHGMPNERIVTFPWGIDLEHFQPQKLDQDMLTGTLKDRPFTLLSTRGWEPIYGTDILAKAFVRAAQQRPNLRLIMLGNGSLAAQIQQIFIRGGLIDPRGEPSASASVVFPGYISYADLPRFYNLADLYVTASHSDGTSISLLEAMACGRPALVSDIPGNREWVTPDKNGWLFPDGDEQALTQRILQAVAAREKLPKMGQSARQLTEERADWKKNFSELLNAYQTALHPAR